ncbi:MAG: hypothetical protein ACI8SE_001107 [Bacteroidia bacterium]|jgi:hypothetical protein
MKLKITLLAVCVVLFLTRVKAQDETPIPQDSIGQEKSVNPLDIYIFLKVGENEVKLRWAPSNADIWLKGNKYGYQLDKAILIPNEELVFRPLVQVVKPWPLEDWQSIADAEHPYAAAAAMAIHGKDKRPVTGFAVADRNLNNKFGMALLSADLDKRAAKASGLSFTDKGTKSGNVIAYRIYILDSLSNPVSDTTVEYVVVGEPYNFVGPNEITTSENEHEVVLYWDKQYMGRLNTAYHIERSADGGKTFKRVNKNPYIDISTNLIKDASMMSYSDSVANNYVPYHYRIIALDAFGDESKPSKAIKAMGRDRTPPLAITELETAESPGSTVNLKWTYPQEESDIAGFKVYHFIKEEKNKKVIAESLGKDARSFTHKTPDTKSTNYYIVSAFDKEGNEARSHVVFAMITDVTPPKAPTNLQATIDTTGGLLLEWDAPKDKDIRGYLVHFSNTRNGSYVVQSGGYLKQTHYVETMTLNTLSEDIFYYVIAVDNSYNASKASEILQVKKPDIIPPNASIFKRYEVRSDGIFIAWNRSTSDDVESVVLSRKTEGEGWEPINAFDQTKPTYFDKNVVQGTYYEYQLTTIDDAGNATVCPKNLHLSARSSFYLDKTPSLVASKEKKDGIRLDITYAQSTKYEFIVYRAIGDNLITTYVVLSGVTTYLDTDVQKDVTYRYTVMARDSNGKESLKTDEITITN